MNISVEGASPRWDPHSTRFHHLFAYGRWLRESALRPPLANPNKGSASGWLQGGLRRWEPSSGQTPARRRENASRADHLKAAETVGKFPLKRVHVGPVQHSEIVLKSVKMGLMKNELEEVDVRDVDVPLRSGW